MGGNGVFTWDGGTFTGEVPRTSIMVSTRTPGEGVLYNPAPGWGHTYCSSYLWVTW